MNHQDALREMSVERYLLGELTGDARNVFEEHLFECPRCAVDLKSGVNLLEGLRSEAAHSAMAVPAREKKSFLPLWLLNPAWMVPALATCLAVVAYQSLVLVPHMKEQVAQANAPAVVNSLVLAGGATRGGSQSKILAPEKGSFLLSVDIPPTGNYTGYRCSLYSPAGAVVWHGEVSPEQAKDTVQIHVPTAATQAGENTLAVQGVRPSGAGMDDVSTRKFILEVYK